MDETDLQLGHEHRQSHEDEEDAQSAEEDLVAGMNAVGGLVAVSKPRQHHAAESDSDEEPGLGEQVADKRFELPVPLFPRRRRWDVEPALKVLTSQRPPG